MERLLLDKRGIDLHHDSDQIAGVNTGRTGVPMQRVSFEKMSCPIARSLERVGEWWSILIMRDALAGRTRFDDFQKSLSIAPNMLTRRLNSLVEAGLLERRQYSNHPPRSEYVPTARGREFHSVLVALLAWGNAHFAPEGPSVVLVDKQTGKTVNPVVVDAKTGQSIDNERFAFAAGPAAGPETRKKYDAAGRGSVQRSKLVHRGSKVT
jgi:DNA-binding HxlR family transcriptional regulator